jgi:hypothetical protein
VICQSQITTDGIVLVNRSDVRVENGNVTNGRYDLADFPPARA